MWIWGLLLAAVIFFMYWWGVGKTSIGGAAECGACAKRKNVEAVE